MPSRLNTLLILSIEYSKNFLVIVRKQLLHSAPSIGNMLNESPGTVPSIGWPRYYDFPEHSRTKWKVLRYSWENTRSFWNFLEKHDETSGSVSNILEIHQRVDRNLKNIRENVRRHHSNSLEHSITSHSPHTASIYKGTCASCRFSLRSTATELTTKK